MKKKIVTVKRSGDYRAYVEGDTTTWGCGKTVDEAIGKLVTANPELFEVEIVFPLPMLLESK